MMDRRSLLGNLALAIGGQVMWRSSSLGRPIHIANGRCFLERALVENSPLNLRRQRLRMQQSYRTRIMLLRRLLILRSLMRVGLRSSMKDLVLMWRLALVPTCGTMIPRQGESWRRLLLIGLMLGILRLRRLWYC